MTSGLRLVCHASTHATRTAAFPADEPLEDKGRSAAIALSGHLGASERVLTSPALCALQTAAALGLQSRVEPALADCDFGRWRGLSLAEIGAHDPEGLSVWMGDLAAAPHGGESFAHLIERIGSWLDGPGFGRHTLAITHASVVRAAIVHILRAPQAFWRIDAGPLSCTDLRHDGRRWSLRAPQL